MQNNPDADIEKLNSSLLLLNKKDFEEKILFQDNDRIVKETAMGLYEQAIKTLIGEILNPAIPFTATVAPKEHCRNCPFKVMCGKQWIRSKKW